MLATDVIRPDRHGSRRPAVVNVKPTENALDRDWLGRVDDRHRIRWYALAEPLMRPTLVEQAPIRMITRPMFGACTTPGTRCTVKTSSCTASNAVHGPCSDATSRAMVAGKAGKSRPGCSMEFAAHVCSSRRYRASHGRHCAISATCLTTRKLGAAQER